MTGKDRRTLAFIQQYPRPYEVYETIMNGKPWPYQTEEMRDFYVKRDRAMIVLLYLLASRISEVLRLKKSQFLVEREKGYVAVRGIQLSKSKVKGKPRRDLFRPEAYLSFSGPRAKLTQIVLDYLEVANEKLFIRDTAQAWKVVTRMTGKPCHWFRAFGENFLYDEWEHDLLAVADYVKVDPRTLQHYIRKSYAKYKAV